MELQTWYIMYDIHDTSKTELVQLVPTRPGKCDLVKLTHDTKLVQLATDIPCSNNQVDPHCVGKYGAMLVDVQYRVTPRVKHVHTHLRSNKHTRK
jgi:hypothetical protein